MDLAVSDLGGLFCLENVPIYFSIIQNFENFYLFVNLHHSKTLLIQGLHYNVLIERIPHQI